VGGGRKDEKGNGGWKWLICILHMYEYRIMKLMKSI
jgi:hypothetical protein